MKVRSKCSYKYCSVFSCIFKRNKIFHCYKRSEVSKNMPHSFVKNTRKC